MVWRCYTEEAHPVAGHRPPPTTCSTREGSREVEADLVSSTKEPLAANDTFHSFSRLMGRCSGRESCTAMSNVCRSTSYLSLPMVEKD